MSKLQIDWLIHEPNRLGMLTMLAESPRSVFEIRRDLELTDGNMATHARLLEAAGYLKQIKNGSITPGRYRQYIGTKLVLTDDGRSALADYLDTTEHIAAMLAVALSMTVRFASQRLTAR